MEANREKYFSRSWALLTRDKGWIKPVLLLGLATLVPIVGPLGVYGYALEWGRLTAWGVDSAPKQKNVNIGECITSGWRGFVAELGWGVIWLIVSIVLSGISLFGVLNLAVFIAGLFVNTILTVCALRTSIYQKIGAGYQANRIFEMVKADFGGIARLTGLKIVMDFVVGLFMSVIGSIMMLPVLTQIAALNISTTTRTLTSAQAAAIVAIVGQLVIPVMIIAIVALIIFAAVKLVYTTAVALWIRNFDVPSWGDSADPIPCLDGTATAGSAPVTPTAEQPAASAPTTPVAPAEGATAGAPVPSAAEKNEPTTVVEEVSLTGDVTESAAPATEAPVETEDPAATEAPASPVENVADSATSEAVEGKSEESASEDAVEPASADETAGEEKSE